MATMGQVLAEAYRLRLLSGVEELLLDYGFENRAGVDEAGRGALAGPVTATAVIVDPSRRVPGVDDSKALTARARAGLADSIKRSVRSHATVAVSARMI